MIQITCIPQMFDNLATYYCTYMGLEVHSEVLPMKQSSLFFERASSAAIKHLFAACDMAYSTRTQSQDYAEYKEKTFGLRTMDLDSLADRLHDVKQILCPPRSKYRRSIQTRLDVVESLIDYSHALKTAHIV